MHRNRSHSLLEPVALARHELESLMPARPRRTLGTLIVVGLLVALGIYVWPELHRTVRMHRM